MEHQASRLITAWPAPWWARKSESDEDAVIHSRLLGSVVGLDGDELSIEFVQRDELQLGSRYMAMARKPAWVRIAGCRVGPDEALRLAECLSTVKLWGAEGLDRSRWTPMRPRVNGRLAS